MRIYSKIDIGKERSVNQDAFFAGEISEDVAFAVVPYEMFDDSGMYIKEHAPYEMTFILGYANGRAGYIPSASCVEHGCYEWECGYYEAGTAEFLVDEYLKLLNGLK